MRPVRRRRLDAGLCIDCGEPREPDRQKCRPCLDKANRRVKEYYRNNPDAAAANAVAVAESRRRLVERRRRAGVCVRCGKRPGWQGMRNCRPCADRQNRQARERRAARPPEPERTGPDPDASSWLRRRW